MGKMQGAKYRLDGSISSIVKRTTDLQDVYYKMNMRLIDIETGVVEWSDEKEIRSVTALLLPAAPAVDEESCIVSSAQYAVITLFAIRYTPL